MTTSNNFAWIKFYMEFADKLLGYKNNREGLLERLFKIDGLPNILKDKKEKGGEKVPLEDICPFTVFALFNGNEKLEEKRRIATSIANAIEVESGAPKSFKGIPVVIQIKFFFDFTFAKKPGDIDTLWNLFEIALHYADNNTAQDRDNFIKACDKTLGVRQVAIQKLSKGLFWIRPKFFCSLGNKSSKYTEDILGEDVYKHRDLASFTATKYIELREVLLGKFKDSKFPVQSFPELVLKALESKSTSPQAEIPTSRSSDQSLSWDDSFIAADKIEKIKDSLEKKKNLILQGPPGTGKTWLASRLAKDFVGEHSHDNVCVLQFHQNMSYEDFVRGWRPTSNGRLELIDGTILKMATKAKEYKNERFVLVIEEINRGNPTQIFGEVLTLIEPDKRNASSAMALSYKKDDDEMIFLPDNLFVIGTMNIADRSLAIVDFALRRRFTFFSLEPEFGDKWQNWLEQNFNIRPEFINTIKGKINQLNETITEDSTLGKHFRVGHSYFTPSAGTEIGDKRKWYEQIIDTQIIPLLEEYWFDAPEKVKNVAGDLLKDI